MTNNKNKENTIIRIASLFSGCGGLDLGFTGGVQFYGMGFPKLPTDLVFANDFDKDVSEYYNSNAMLTPPIFAWVVAKAVIKHIKNN